MHVVYTDRHQLHAPEYFLARGKRQPSPEVPLRAENLVAAARAAGHTIVAPDDFGPAPRAAIHDARHLQFLETAHRRWAEFDGAGPEVVPNVHPTRNMSAYPQGIVGQAGWHMADTACPIGAHSWEVACAGANVATHAAALVLDGENVAYAVCRPPGHHAYHDMIGGFCYLNNVAVAAQYMRAKLTRVAIIDIDVHHGNGTQGIFYGRSDVLFVSLHADPTAFYPFYAGYADERGTGDGAGCNLNLPIAIGTGDNAYLAALDRGIAEIRDFAPEALLVSLGFDAFRDDPLSPLEVSGDGFRAAGAALAALDLPTALIQEGGYDCASLGANLINFLEGFGRG